jgi:hypothetical protein
LAHKIGLTGFDNLSALTGGANPYDENTKKDWAPINGFGVRLWGQVYFVSIFYFSLKILLREVICTGG